MEEESVVNGQGTSLNMLDDVDRLTKAGLEEEQAKAVVRIQYNLIHSHLATKRDIADVNKDIAYVKKDIADVKKDIADVKKDIADVKKEIAELRSATKRDIEELRSATKRDIEDVKKEIKELDLKIEIVKKDLKIWMGGFAITGLGVLVAFAKLGLLTPM